MAKSRTTHDKLQSDCFIWFHNTYPKLRGLMWSTYNNPKNAAHGAYLKSIGMVKGVHDMQFYYNGVLYGFEFKVGSDKLRPEQIKWGKQIEMQGGEWYEIRSVEEFKQIVKDKLK